MVLFSLCALGMGLFNSCDNNAPLDADTRASIDSISAVQISHARKELDSLCLVAEKTVLPQIIDSIKRHRLQEIEQQMKSVPK